MNIIIDQNHCTACGKCVRVCPSLVFTQEPKLKPIVDQAWACIGCGHCVAACNDTAMNHSLFPPEKIHLIHYENYPTAEQLLLLIKSRRSNRVITKTPIPREFLALIVEASHRAPTASNRQEVSFTLLTQKDDLQRVSKFTMSVFGSMISKMDNIILRPLVKRFLPDVYRYIPLFKRFEDEKNKGNDLILRNATALLLVHTPSKNRFGCEDANLAYQNGSLMAETLGVTQFYTGFVLAAVKRKKGKLEKILGIDGQIQAGMALGIPAFRYSNYIDRKELQINSINI